MRPRCKASAHARVQTRPRPVSVVSEEGEEEVQLKGTAYIVMAYIVMAYVVMAYTVMAYIVVACTFMW